MWNLQTIQLINKKAHELALAGKPERLALTEAGIVTPTRIDSCQLPVERKEDENC